MNNASPKSPAFGDLSQHELVQLVLKQLVPDMLKALEPARKGSKATPRSAAVVTKDPLFWYNHSINDLVDNLQKRLGRLSKATELMRITAPARSGEPLMNPTEWVKYHYEAHTVSLLSVPDICLQLVDAVFRLGTPPRARTRQTLLENACVATQPAVGRAMKTLFDTVEAKRRPRNRSIHQGEESTPGTPYWHYFEVFVLGEDQTGERTRMLNSLMPRELAAVRRQLQEENRAVLAAVKAVLNALLPVYRQTAAAILPRTTHDIDV
jgi:hypothetical protein